MAIGSDQNDAVLIVDDETDLLSGLARVVEIEIGCRVRTAQNGADALQILAKESVDLVLADIRMPGMDGMELLGAVQAMDASISVILMTGYGTIEKAVKAIKAGAYDFIQKPFDEERLVHLLRKGLERNRLVRENNRLMKELCGRVSFESMVGNSRPMRQLFRSVEMLARSDVTVLVFGETGTGKDLVARAIHRLSARAEQPMVIVNCPALPESILESELFGYCKGAFTGADSDKKGLFDSAHGGTLFLDEIGDLSPSVQTKLLRVLQDKTIQPLGTTESHEVNVRIIAATNRDLEQKMREHQFREDLYYRLNVATLTLPPLREIREDIPLLVEHFSEKLAAEIGGKKKRLAPEVMEFLLHQQWPGNIRELENTLRGWYALTSEDEITQDRLPLPSTAIDIPLGPADLDRPYKELKNQAIEAFTRAYLLRLLEYTRGNVTRSAQISGIKRQSLQKIIRRYNIPVTRFRE